MRASPVNAPVHFSPEVFPCSVNVPVMFGPNITGTIKDKNNSGFLSDDYVADIIRSGALDLIAGQQPTSANGDWYSNIPVGITFDASRSNFVYDKSSTVQPASIRLIHCIKT